MGLAKARSAIIKQKLAVQLSQGGSKATSCGYLSRDDKDMLTALDLKSLRNCKFLASSPPS